MIENFARILRNSIPSPRFVGRYGGNGFVDVSYAFDGLSLKICQIAPSAFYLIRQTDVSMKII